MDIKLAHKAVKTARLAASEATLGHDDTAENQGRIAGDLAARAGMTLAQLRAEAGPSIHEPSAHTAWNAIVDAWYDAQPSEVPLDDIRGMIEAMRQDGKIGWALVVASMLGEIQRRRAV